MDLLLDDRIDYQVNHNYEQFGIGFHSALKTIQESVCDIIN